MGGLLIVGLPLFLPIVVVVGSGLLGVGGVGVGLYASTKLGRDQVGGLVSPLYNTVASTPSGQRLLYETGPRPTPVSVARLILPTGLFGKLVVSLLIDLIGSSSYL